MQVGEAGIHSIRRPHSCRRRWLWRNSPSSTHPGNKPLLNQNFLRSAAYVHTASTSLSEPPVAHQRHIGVELEHRGGHLRGHRAGKARKMSAFSSPLTTIRMRRACIMFLIPMLRAWRGTSSRFRRSAVGVDGPVSQMTTWVSRPKSSPGSLKAMCPLWPMPSSCRSMPPKSWMSLL